MDIEYEIIIIQISVFVGPILVLLKFEFTKSNDLYKRNKFTEFNCIKKDWDTISQYIGQSYKFCRPNIFNFNNIKLDELDWEKIGVK